MLIAALVGLSIAWTVAELKSGRLARMTLGVALVSLVGVLGSVFGTVDAYDTSLHHRESLPLIEVGTRAGLLSLSEGSMEIVALTNIEVTAPGERGDYEATH